MILISGEGLWWDLCVRFCFGDFVVKLWHNFVTQSCVKIWHKFVSDTTFLVLWPVGHENTKSGDFGDFGAARDERKPRFCVFVIFVFFSLFCLLTFFFTFGHKSERKRCERFADSFLNFVHKRVCRLFWELCAQSCGKRWHLRVPPGDRGSPLSKICRCEHFWELCSQSCVKKWLNSCAMWTTTT